MRYVLWFTPSICIFIGVFLLSTVVTVPVRRQVDIAHLDKLAHSFAYFVLMLSLLIGCHKVDWLKKKIWFLLVVVTILYGVALEWVQHTFFIGRHFEWVDAAANGGGVLVGSLVFPLFRQWLARHSVRINLYSFLGSGLISLLFFEI